MAVFHRLAAALLCVALIVIGTNRATAADPIKIGLLLTYVGPTAVFARYEDKGARLLIEQVNKAGGINGSQIELVNYDTEGKPDRAASLYGALPTRTKFQRLSDPTVFLFFLACLEYQARRRCFRSRHQASMNW